MRARVQLLNKPGSGANCVNAARQGACASKMIQDNCCASCGGVVPATATSAGGVPSCKDATAPEMEKKLNKKGVSCPHAAQQGACTIASIKNMCCESCSEQSSANGGNCIETPQAELEALLKKKGVSCPGAAAAGACKHDQIAELCCGSCRANSNVAHMARCVKDATDSELRKVFGGGAVPHTACV